MKVLKNNTYSKLKQTEENFGKFLRVTTKKLKELEKQGKAKFIQNEPGSGISEWKVKGKHLYFNEFPNKFTTFSEFYIIKDDKEEMSDCKNFTYYDLITLLFS